MCVCLCFMVSTVLRAPAVFGVSRPSTDVTLPYVNTRRSCRFVYPWGWGALTFGWIISVKGWSSFHGLHFHPCFTLFIFVSRFASLSLFH